MWKQEGGISLFSCSSQIVTINNYNHYCVVDAHVYNCMNQVRITIRQATEEVQHGDVTARVINNCACNAITSDKYSFS